MKYLGKVLEGVLPDRLLKIPLMTEWEALE